MTQTEVEALFTRADGKYAFARWERPIAPIVFGVEAETLSVIKGAFEAVVALAGHNMAETDPELKREMLELLTIMDSEETDRYLFEMLEKKG